MIICMAVMVTRPTTTNRLHPLPDLQKVYFMQQFLDIAFMLVYNLHNLCS
jgi:hypothetical protein